MALRHVGHFACLTLGTVTEHDPPVSADAEWRQKYSAPSVP